MNKDKKSTRKEQYIENRKKLIALSQGIRQLVKEGAFDTVNEGLREMYEEENESINEFNTFHQWKDKGYTITKGSKAFLFWGQPRRYEQTPEGTDEPEEFKYWPICYLFSNEQVFKKGETNEATPEPKAKRQPQPVAELDELLN